MAQFFGTFCAGLSGSYRCGFLSISNNTIAHIIVANQILCEIARLSAVLTPVSVDLSVLRYVPRPNVLPNAPRS